MAFSVNYVVAPTDGEPLVILGTPAPTVVTGQPYSFTPQVSGGVAPYLFTRFAGTSLPSGWTFSMLTGELATASAGAPGAITGQVVRVTDVLGATADFGPFEVTILAGEVTPPPDPEPLAGVFYVAPETGDDANDGLTPATAWRNAPGTKNGATGVAAAKVLAPGETLRFVGGQRLAKTLFLPAGGTEANPVIYESWSALGPLTRCQLAGSDPVTLVRPATSQEDAGGAANWQDLHVIEFVQTGSNTVCVRFFDDLGVMPIGRFPELADPFFEDDVGSSSNINVGKYVGGIAAAPLIEEGAIQNQSIADICADQIGYARIGLWRRTELVDRHTVTAVAGDKTTIVPVGTYTNTTSQLYPIGRAYITNSRHHCTRPGHFATIAPGKAVVMLRGSTNIRIGRDRQLLNADGKSHVRIRGFDFAHGMMIGNIQQQVVTNNTSPLSAGAGTTGIQFDDCYFHDMYGERRGGLSPVVFGAANMIGYRVNRCRFRNLVQTGLTRAPNNNFFECVLHRLGGTAFSGRGGTSTTRKRNICSGVKGIHANVLSLYGDGLGIEAEDNFVFDSARPLNLQGEKDGDPAKIQDRKIRRNVLIANGDSPAINNNSSSFNYPINTMEITGNVAISLNSNGIQVYTHLLNLTMGNNIGNSLRIATASSNNVDNRDTWELGTFTQVSRDWADSGTLTEDYCRMEGPGGVFYELDLRDVAPVA